MTTTRFSVKIKLILRQTTFWYSFLVGLLCVMFVAMTLAALHQQGNTNINRLTQTSANGIAAVIENDLKMRMSALSKFTSLPQFSVNMMPNDWLKISTTFYETQSVYQSIVMVDSDFNVRSVTPIEENEAAQNLNLLLTPTAIAGVQEVQQSQAAVIAIPFKSASGAPGLAFYVPVVNQLGDDSLLEGFLSGFMLLDNYFTLVLPSFSLSEHEITVFLNAQEIYSDRLKHDDINENWGKIASFDLQGQSWQIGIHPKASFLNKTYYRMAVVLSVLGGMLSLLISVATYGFLTLREQARIIKDDRNKVDHLLKNLPGMAYQSFDTENWPSILVSEGCEALTGYSKAEFEVHSVLWGKIIHPEDYKKVHAKVHDAILHKIPYELEYRILNKQNNIRLVWERGEAVVSLLNDKLILEGFVTDITNVKQAEMEVQRSHAFSDAIVESVIEAVITIDQHGKIKGFNSAAKAMFGYTFEELEHKSVNLLMPNSSGQTHDHDQYVAAYMQTHAANVIGKGRELEARRKDGSVFPIHISVNEILDQDNTMFVGLIRDISKQRVNEEQARIHTEQMAHADRLNSLGEMAAGLAHEVNQPLTAISLFSRAGKAFCEDGKFDRLPEIFEKLSQHALRAGAVLERVQSMTAQGEREKELVDSRTLIEEVVTLAESEARIRDINITVAFCQSTAQVYMDRVQIQQVLLNLLRNGMEAMQLVSLVNGNTITVTSDIKDNKQLTISVIDSGCGLDDSMTEKLFSAFNSTKKNGMGIGLSISKSIIEDHGGIIDYAKNDSAGSTFYFTLPIAKKR